MKGAVAVGDVIGNRELHDFIAKLLLDLAADAHPAHAKMNVRLLRRLAALPRQNPGAGLHQIKRHERPLLGRCVESEDEEQSGEQAVHVSVFLSAYQ